MANLSYLSPKTEARGSPIHGKELFAVAPIPKDEIVCVKGGYIFNRQTLSAVAPLLGPAKIQIGDDLFIGPPQMRLDPPPHPTPVGLKSTSDSETLC
jgi:hypothetical protein